MTASMQVHEENFVARFSTGTLSEMEMRRIGFGEVTGHPHLIERTKAEVAGIVASLVEILKQCPMKMHIDCLGFMQN